jgi:hypothetical protein
MEKADPGRRWPHYPRWNPATLGGRLMYQAKRSQSIDRRVVADAARRAEITRLRTQLQRFLTTAEGRIWDAGDSAFVENHYEEIKRLAAGGEPRRAS